MEGVFDDPAESFAQVEVAHVVGELTDEQYAVIRTAVVQGPCDELRSCLSHDAPVGARYQPGAALALVTLPTSTPFVCVV